MVEPLRELNRICQKPDYKKVGNWYVRTILRDAALPATWLLLHTSVSADQVTLISVGISLLGMILFAVPGPAAFLLGAVLLQLWYYLDHVDGQIARYRKTASLTGRFLDFLTHHIVHTALFFALGFYGYAVSGNILFVIWGFVASLGILAFNVMHDVKYKAFFEKLETLRAQEAITLQRRVIPECSNRGSSSGFPLKTCGNDSLDVDGSKIMLAGRRTFSFLHKVCEIHVMMNVLTLAAILQFFAGAVDLRLVLFLVYGVLAPAIAVLKLAYILKNKKIDSDYRELFGA